MTIIHEPQSDVTLDAFGWACARIASASNQEYVMPAMCGILVPYCMLSDALTVASSFDSYGQSISVNVLPHSTNPKTWRVNYGASQDKCVSVIFGPAKDTQG